MTHRGTRVYTKPELGTNTSEKGQRIDPKPKPKPSQSKLRREPSQAKPSPRVKHKPSARRQRSPDGLGLERAMSFRESLGQDVRPRQCRYLT